MASPSSAFCGWPTEVSDHKIEVVALTDVQRHPNADKLSIVSLYGGGYQVIVNTEAWEGKTKGAYIPPDSLVPLDLEAFSWLYDLGRTPKVIDGRSYHLVRAVKLRGLPSQGMLLPVPDDTPLGADLAATYEILHWDPPEPEEKVQPVGKQRQPSPQRVPFVYDLESGRKYGALLEEGEPVMVTEKLHGANMRVVWEKGRLRIASRRLWLDARGYFRWAQIKNLFRPSFWKRNWNQIWTKEFWFIYASTSAFRDAIKALPKVEEFCRQNPGVILFGELYGPVQKGFTYDWSKGPALFRIFDIMDPSGEWMEPRSRFKLCRSLGLPHVPVLAEEVPFHMATHLGEAEGKTLLGGGHVREGVVVTALNHRVVVGLGRPVVKFVGNGYLMKEVA